MAKRRRVYQPRFFDGRMIMPDEIERIHKEVLKFDRIEAISDLMRELIEDLWPEAAEITNPSSPVGTSAPNAFTATRLLRHRRTSARPPQFIWSMYPACNDAEHDKGCS
jgi:hypothetical protein